MAARGMDVRYRGGDTNLQKGSFDKAGHDQEHPKLRDETPNLFSERIWFILLLFYAFILAVIFKADMSLPMPKSVSEVTVGEFCEERARMHVSNLTSFGDRPSGSYANEKLAVGYIVGVLKDIQKRAKPVHRVQIDVQEVSGSFDIDFLGGFTTIYKNVKNILVKLSPRSTTSSHSLLVSCHFDTVVNSPGASDDSVSCAVMLEVLNQLAQSDQPLKHSLIMNFNGAEENILQASHGFITQHSWARDVRAFINLEAAGAGGREMVFQTGPEHPWLISEYERSALHPYGNVFGQELFQAGVIPSDTDFRIYRDFGKIPGIDIAYISNGYVYHTKWDNLDFIPPGSIQRAGENLLATVRSVMSSPYLADPGQYRHGSMVFFDVLGLYMVLYPQRMGMIVNGLVLVAVTFGILRKIFDRSTTGYHGFAYFSQLLRMILVIFCSWMATAAICSGLAILLTVAGCSMSWFTRSYLIGGLYEAPALIAAIGVHCAAKHYLFRNKELWKLEHIHFDATIVIWSLILAAFTYNGLCSAYVSLVWVFFPLILRDRLLTWLQLFVKARTDVFLFFYLLSLTFPFLITCYLLVGVYQFFIPVLGRTGTETVPDLVIAHVAALCVYIKTNFLSLVFVTRSMKKVLTALLLFSVITYALVLLTPLSFPYGSNPKKPTPQRSIIHHTERKFYDIHGELYKHDSGMWHIPFDYVGVKPLLPYQKRLRNAHTVDCEGEMYCAMPYYFPLATMMRETYYVPAKPPVVSIPVSVVKQSHEVQRQKYYSIHKISLNVTGPDHIIVYISPKSDIDLSRWSLNHEPPYPSYLWDDRYIYFVYYSYGENPGPWTFTLDLMVPHNYHTDSGIVDIAFSGHYLHGKDRLNPELNAYLSVFPDWSYPVGWTATYQAFVY